MYEKYSMKGCVERQIQHSALPRAVFASRHYLSAVFFIHTSIGGALIVILYFLVVLSFSSTRIAPIFKVSVSVYKVDSSSKVI